MKNSCVTLNCNNCNCQDWFWSVVLEKTLESPLDCKEIQPAHPKGNQSWILVGLMPKLKLQYSGHLLQRTDSLETTLMLRKIEGGRRGWQRMRCLDGITDSMGVGLSELQVWWWTGKQSWVLAELHVTEQLSWTEIFIWTWIFAWLSCFINPISETQWHTVTGSVTYCFTQWIFIVNIYIWLDKCMGFPGGWDGKASVCNARDLSSISRSGRIPGEGKGYSL